MSAIRRVFSGSVAAWGGIGINLAQRLAIVPIILSFWSSNQYASYLVITAYILLIRVLSRSFEGVTAFECLKTGSENTVRLRMLICSTSVINLCIEFLVSICLIVVLFLTQLYPAHLNIKSMVLILGVNFLIRTLFEYPSAIVAAALSCFGYQPKYAWLALIPQGIQPIGVLAAILCGFNVVGVVLVELALPTFIGAIIFWLIARPWAKTRQIWGWHTNFKSGCSLWFHSLLNFGKDISEMIRQQGIRLILAPMSNAAGLTAFATMRTGANVALQGLGTIANPLMPELMRFLNQGDQERVEAAFSTVWLMVMAIMAPAVILLQICAEPLFTLWTRGKVIFDPALFALLSLGVLVYAMAQPAMAVVQGNNLLRPQFILSFIAGGVVVGSMFAFVPYLGILGSGWALLLGEMAAAIGYRKVAAAWLNENKLYWPRKASYRVMLSVSVAGIAMLSIAWLPHWHFVFLIISLIMLMANLKSYFHHLPDLAKHRITALIAKLPGGRRFCTVFMFSRT